MKKFFLLALSGLMFLVTSTANALPVRVDDGLTKIEKTVKQIDYVFVDSQTADTVTHNFDYILPTKATSPATITASYLSERTLEYDKVRPPHEMYNGNRNKNLQLNYPAGPEIRPLR